MNDVFASDDSLLNFFPAQIRGGGRPVTKPLAGRTGARIVGTISGTAHRPRPINSAVHSATNGTGGASTADTHHTTTDHELRTNDEPAELPARPTL